MFLTDTEIKTLITSGAVEHVKSMPNMDSHDSPVQPCSLDLRIGLIFLPGAADDSLGSRQKPLQTHSLGVGETVVVETLEVFHLPRHIGAFGFPPTSVSNVGVLVTNLGHIDPGFHGSVKFTLVNMGRKPYSLRRGDNISTTLLFSLSNPVSRDYSERNPSISATSPALGVREDVLASLPSDFLDLENRATSAAKKGVTGTWEFRTSVLAGIGAAIAFAANIWISINNSNELKVDFEQYKQLVEQRLAIAATAAEAKQAANENSAAIRRLEAQLDLALKPSTTSKTPTP